MFVSLSILSLSALSIDGVVSPEFLFRFVMASYPESLSNASSDKWSASRRQMLEERCKKVRFCDLTTSQVLSLCDEDQLTMSTGYILNMREESQWNKFLTMLQSPISEPLRACLSKEPVIFTEYIDINDEDVTHGIFQILKTLSGFDSSPLYSNIPILQKTLLYWNLSFTRWGRINWRRASMEAKIRTMKLSAQVIVEYAKKSKQRQDIIKVLLSMAPVLSTLAVLHFSFLENFIEEFVETKATNFEKAVILSHVAMLLQHVTNLQYVHHCTNVRSIVNSFVLPLARRHFKGRSFNNQQIQNTGGFGVTGDSSCNSLPDPAHQNPPRQKQSVDQNAAEKRKLKCMTFKLSGYKVYLVWKSSKGTDISMDSSKVDGETLDCWIGTICRNFLDLQVRYPQSNFNSMGIELLRLTILSISFIQPWMKGCAAFSGNQCRLLKCSDSLKHFHLSMVLIARYNYQQRSPASVELFSCLLNTHLDWDAIQLRTHAVDLLIMASFHPTSLGVAQADHNLVRAISMQWKDMRVPENTVLFSFQVLNRHFHEDHFEPFIHILFGELPNVLEHRCDVSKLDQAFFEAGLELVELMFTWFTLVIGNLQSSPVKSCVEDTVCDENEGGNLEVLAAPSRVDQVGMKAGEGDASVPPPLKRQRRGRSPETVAVLPLHIKRLAASNTLNLYVTVLVRIVTVAVDHGEDDISGNASFLVEKACKLYKCLVQASLAKVDETFEIVMKNIY